MCLTAFCLDYFISLPSVILSDSYQPLNPRQAKEDGRGYELVFYFTLNENSLREWQNPNSSVPAINLLRRFVRHFSFYSLTLL